MVEEVVKHLQVVSVVSCRLEFRIPEVLAQELSPIWISEILSNFIQNLLLFIRRLYVLLCTFLNLECVELLI